MIMHELLKIKESIRGKALAELTPQQVDFLIKYKLPVVLPYGDVDPWPKVGYILSYGELVEKMPVGCPSSRIAYIALLSLLDGAGDNYLDLDVSLQRRVLFREDVKAEFARYDIEDEIVLGIQEEFEEIHKNIVAEGKNLFSDDALEDIKVACPKFLSIASQATNCCENCDSPMGVFCHPEELVYICFDCGEHLFDQEEGMARGG